MELRTCNTCGATKPITAYHYDKNCRGGRRVICRDCVNGRLRAAKQRESANGAIAGTFPWRPDRIYRGPTGKPIQTRQIHGDDN